MGFHHPETHGSRTARARDRNEILIRDRVVIDFEFQFENVEGEEKECGKSK